MEAIGTLAGGIAHDFNNILTSVIGYTEMTLRNLPEDSLVRKNLDQILKAGFRATDLVHQILAFSRPKEQERKPVHVAGIIKEALKLLRASLPTTIEIRQNIADPPESGIVMGDPTQIHQILMNLCTNAADAMRARGGILDVSLVEVEMDSPAAALFPDMKCEPYLSLTVSDTGHGMDNAVVERIFDPFFTTKEPGKGTGLGLAVAHTIVKEHGGGITVRSAPGEGTSFHVFLPSIKHRASREAEVIKELHTGNEHILFVDDEEDVVELACQMLESLGYRITAKAGSLEALAALRAEPYQFDVVISDQTMPHMTGAELAKEILKIRPDAPIILCTGFSETITPEMAKAIGIREFIMKPFAMRDLTDAIRRSLDGPEAI
jgi:CheY-like chemotaxis protein